MNLPTLGPFLVGDSFVLRLRAEYPADTLADASAVALRLRSPAGVVTSYTTGDFSHDGEGLYSIQLRAGAAPTIYQEPWTFTAETTFATSPATKKSYTGAITVLPDPTA